MTTRISRRAIACAFLATTALVASPVFGQAASGPPPLHYAVDVNGVDLVTGKFRYSMTEAVIGSGEGAIPLMRFQGDGTFRTNWSGGLYTASDGFVYAEFGGKAESFSLSGGVYTSRTGNGASLVTGGMGFIYTAPDGTQVEYQNRTEDNYYPLQGYECPNGTQRGDCAIPIRVTKPNGMKFSINWMIVEKCTVQTPDCVGGVGTGFYRFQGVSSSAGYSFTVNYLTDSPGNFSAPQTNWYVKTGVTFANSVTSCTGVCPSLTYSTSGTFTITDAMGRQWKPGTSSIQLPGETSPSVVASITSGVVTSVTNHGVTTSYSRSVVGNTATAIITDALSHSKTAVADIAKGRITSVQDELGHTTSYQYDASGRLTQMTLPEGNYVQYAYDSRGNVTSTTAVAKSSSGLANLVTSAGFDSSCTNIVTCNKPNTTTDAKGNVTDYTYDGTHGGVLTVTRPAPTTGAVRPQVRYSYSQVTGAPGDLVTLLTGTSACQTSAACTGAADETKTTTVYNSNLLPTSVSSGSGTTTLATQSYTYDPAGNRLTVDGPLSGTGDTTRYRYDADRELTGAVDPDPDGAGPLKLRAVRNSYRLDGQLGQQEIGTVADQSDSAWTNFASAYLSYRNFDAKGRVERDHIWANGVHYAVRDYVYDGLGRVSCSVTKMDPNNWGAQATSCAPWQVNGPYGPDRVVQTIYDAAGQPTQLKVGVGTADAATERTLTYTNNGLVGTLLDAENNKTTYVYDGFDRLSQTQYPSSTKGSGTSNAGDYEQLSYDANSNVTAWRNRAGALTLFTYDNLNRMTIKTVPDEPWWLDTSRSRDVYYGYDNLGRMTFARFDSASGEGVTNVYDALGRMTSSTTSMDGVSRSFTSSYDAAGNRLSLTGHAGYNAGFGYDVLGRMTSYLEAQTTPAVSIGYDDLGRRVSLGSGVGGTSSSTSYGYDAVSRLTSLTHDLAGTANDLTETFAYNPASQVTSTTRSNDAYAFTGNANASTSYASNGLNQLTSAGAASLSYDARGNLTSDGTNSYVYDHENRLVWASGPRPVALWYDPLGRLWRTETWDTHEVRRYIYDGDQLIREYDGAGNTLNSYVHGPAVDEVLVDYQDSPTWVRRFPHADRLGSIVALADSSGNATSINRSRRVRQPRLRQPRAVPVHRPDVDAGDRPL
jgi:YD repeat-containing protein